MRYLLHHWNLKTGSVLWLQMMSQLFFFTVAEEEEIPNVMAVHW